MEATMAAVPEPHGERSNIPLNVSMFKFIWIWNIVFDGNQVYRYLLIAKV